MDTHTFFLIMRNEMKLQMRSWVFRFFIVLSLVGIVAYQMYIHGAGSSAWKMVANSTPMTPPPIITMRS